MLSQENTLCQRCPQSADNFAIFHWEPISRFISGWCRRQSIRKLTSDSKQSSSTVCKRKCYRKPLIVGVFFSNISLWDILAT